MSNFSYVPLHLPSRYTFSANRHPSNNEHNGTTDGP